jgi:hypothetical protein
MKHEDMKATYKTRKDRFTLRIVLIGYLILIVCVGLPVLFAPKDELSFHWAYLIPLAIVAFMLYALTSALMKFFASFTIAENSVDITLPPFHRRRIPADQIAAARILDAEESRSVFEGAIREQFAIKEDPDIARYVRLLRKKVPAYKYLSVAPSATMATRGQMEHLASLKVKSKERMVLVKLKDGKELYLSPDDIDGFMRSLAAIGPG